MKPNFEKIINGQLTAFTPANLDELFDAIRCDWISCYSTELSETFVINLN